MRPRAARASRRGRVEQGTRSNSHRTDAARATQPRTPALVGSAGDLSECPLSMRELEVLRLMALEGLQTAGIAHRLRLSASTVRQHCYNAYRKLNVTHAVQALVVCFNAGWIDPVQTRIQDPSRFSDRVTWEPTPAQRVYLEAFDEHLRAGEDQSSLEEAKRRTDAALVAMELPRRSNPSRDWIDDLVAAVIRIHPDVDIAS